MVLKEEPLRDARMERLRWVWGGEVLLFWQNPSFLLQISLREDFAQHERLSVRPSPSQDPAPRSRRLPGAWTASGTAPTGTAESQGGPEHLPPPGSLPGQRGNAQTTFKVGTVAGSRHQPHARTTCLEGSRVPTLTARVLLQSLKRRAPDPTLFPQQPPSTCNPSNSHFKMLINPDREIQKPFQPGFGHIQETSKDKWRQRRILISYSSTRPWFDHHCTRRQQPVNQILFWEAASSGLFGKREASEALIPQSFLQTGSFSSSCYVKL